MLPLILLAFILSSAAPKPGLRWKKMPLLSPEARAAGVTPGGEGGQWPRGPVAVGPADPRFLLLPVDVGGVYRSLDGGARWEIAMVGWNARGANAFVMDPHNARRALGVAGNSMDWNPGWGPSPHGLYLTADKAGSWRQVLAVRDGIGGAVAYDAASYRRAVGYCALAYYLSPREGLFRSGDGGATWRRLGDGPVPGVTGHDWTQGGAIISSLAVDGRTGAVYIGGAGGLFRSADHGASWTRLREADVYGLSLTPNGAVYVSGREGVAVSRDGGRAWQALPCAGLDTLGGKPAQNLAVSPMDPRRMLCWVAGDNWNWKRYVSHDGGATWRAVTLERGFAPLPMNARQGYAAWSPASAQIAWSLGGDWVTKSTDGGLTFRWSANGYNGIMTGGKFNFSPHAPETVFLGFQDYNGASTQDGGRTWRWRDVSGKGWGGHEYGAFALNRQVMWAGDAEDWGGPRRLRLTRDGGRTWVFVNGRDGRPMEYRGPDVSCGDPGDPLAGFAGSLRTADGGVTWQPMPGCDGVYTFSPADGTLYGKKDRAVVRSTDHGVTWQPVATVEGGFDDLACDPAHGRLYAASQERLKVWEAGRWSVLETPRDQYGGIRILTVAVDPKAPTVLYAGGPRDIYASHATLCRSTDGGRTWRNLTVTTPLAPGAEGGPHEVSAVRVHPVTREAWAAGECFGLWRIAPPAPGEKGLPAAAASAPRAAPLPAR